MNLVIVESPAKGKTIEKYLGKDYKVLASFGHVRDLPKKNIGVDTKNNFEPSYEIPLKAKKTVTALKKEIAKADNLYLATDYDREGEAIAWHILKATGLDNSKVISNKLKVHRITFTEITKQAIQEAVKNPRQLDINLVDAQQARRILDRLVGYKLSPFLWRKVAQGLSAGRVQSVAVRLIVEKEREIEKFKTDEYWTIEADLSKDSKTFKAILIAKDDQKIDKLGIKTDKDAQEITSDLATDTSKVSEVKTEDKKRYPSPPFMTSTLQQAAGSKLGYSAKQTMKLAQDLYEGGYITYMRTDSLNIAQSALKQAGQVIKSKYGPQYCLDTPRYYKTKSKGAQEAHEAIRPTDMSVDTVPLSSQHQRLYKTIWQRMLASQAKEAEVTETNAHILSQGKKSKYTFKAQGIRTKFAGFMKIYDNDISENILPVLKENDKVKLEKIEKTQHFTEPPARYTEGSLIKELEKRGIGRPSTYAPTIATIQDRGYVEKKEGKFTPKDIGLAVNDLLVEHFPEIVDYEFTAKMEANLDDIAEGKLKWQPVIKEFYDPFSKNLTAKTESVQKSQLEEKTDEKCPKCSKELVIKIGRYGKFYACSGYPDCKYTKPVLSEETAKVMEQKTDEKCPKCGKPMVVKEGRFGAFLACEGYPECKSTKPIEIKSGVKCPNCGGDLLFKKSRKGRGFWGCNGYPKCKTAFWQEPTNQKCEKCGSLMTKDKKGTITCSNNANCKDRNAK